MKIKQILIAGTLLVSVASFSQKDELKALKKIYNKEVITPTEVTDYKNNLTKLESVAAEETDKVYLSFYKSILPFLEVQSLGTNSTPAQIDRYMTTSSIPKLVSGMIEILDFEKKSGKKVFTDKVNQDIQKVKPILVNSAVSLGEAKKYKEASEVLYSIYTLDKTDQEKLYYAASYAVNDKDYDKALDYYNQLKSLNYSGEKTLYYAVSKENKIEDYFGDDKATRDTYVKLGTHEKPRDEKVTSKKGEIFKNIALILVQQGKSAEAKAAITEARKANPDDTSLILAEADFYLKDKDFTSYSNLVNEVLAKDPNNVTLIFNLGVISADSNKIEDAEKYYRRAIELDPTYFAAFLNLAELKLRSDKVLVEQMNKLGTSDSDNKKFDVLREKQKANYREVLPLLEKAVELKSDNDAAKSTLLGVYQALDMTEKYKELKSRK